MVPYLYNGERLSFNMAADMRGATCAGTKTLKTPTEVTPLFNTSSVIIL